MKRRILSIVLVIGMLLSLSACGKPADDPVEDNANSVVNVDVDSLVNEMAEVDFDGYLAAKATITIRNTDIDLYRMEADLESRDAVARLSNGKISVSIQEDGTIGNPEEMSFQAWTDGRSVWTDDGGGWLRVAADESDAPFLDMPAICKAVDGLDFSEADVSMDDGGAVARWSGLVDGLPITLAGGSPIADFSESGYTVWSAEIRFGADGKLHSVYVNAATPDSPEGSGVSVEFTFSGIGGDVELSVPDEVRGPES